MSGRQVAQWELSSPLKYGLTACIPACAAARACSTENMAVPSVSMPSACSTTAALTPQEVVGILMQKRSLAVSHPSQKLDSLGDTLGFECFRVSSSVIHNLLLVVSEDGRDLRQYTP